jgi:CheY-like chemotaxis protein
MPREILVADPNKAAHKAFEEIFKESGYNLIFSENGEDALLKMKLFKPALVIADVTMSDKGGKELCQMLKGDPDLNKVPFILLGGPFDEDIEEERSQVRADGAITKPLKKESVLKLVDGLLTGERVEGAMEGEGEILDLQPMDEVAETAISGEEEEIIDLVDIIEEPAPKAEEAPLGPPAAVVGGGEAKELEEAGIFGTEALAGLELSGDMGVKKGEEAIQAPEVETPEPGPDFGPVLEEGPAEMELKVPSEEEMAGLFGFEEAPESERAEFGDQEIAGILPTEEGGELPQDLFKDEATSEEIEGLPFEEAAKPEELEVEIGGVTEELPTAGIGELPKDILKEPGLEEALAGEIEGLPEETTPELEGLELEVGGVTEELPTAGIGELPKDILKEPGLEEALAGEIEELPEEGIPELEGLELEVGGVTEELPTEGIGELPKDIFKERGLEEALAEEIEDLPEDLLGGKDLEEPAEQWKIRPDEGEELEGLDLGGEIEAREGEEGIIEEALKELSEEAPEKEGLEEFPTEELERPPHEASQEMDLEGLAEKMLDEEGFQVLGEGGPKEGEFGEFHEEVFKEGELEKLAEEATMEGESEGFPEGALAEAIEEFTGEAVRGEEQIGARLPRQGPIQDAIKELVEGVSAKIIPRLTEAIAAAAAEKIEKAVERIVPEMAEKAIQKEIQRLEDLKKGDEFDV